jgi:hypothetical protein
VPSTALFNVRRGVDLALYRPLLMEKFQAVTLHLDLPANGSTPITLGTPRAVLLAVRVSGGRLRPAWPES